jgi:hypothetical protein
MKASGSTAPRRPPMRRKNRPFANMTGREWQNLAIAALMALYVIQIGLDAAWGNIFSHLSIDFASFWSAGYIADHFGYVRVYDLATMQKVQEQLWPKTAAAAAGFQVADTLLAALLDRIPALCASSARPGILDMDGT